jgi:hypothetical protein
MHFRHNGVQFLISYLPRWLRTRRFSEPFEEKAFVLTIIYIFPWNGTHFLLRLQNSLKTHPFEEKAFLLTIICIFPWKGTHFWLRLQNNLNNASFRGKSIFVDYHLHFSLKGYTSFTICDPPYSQVTTFSTVFFTKVMKIIDYRSDRTWSPHGRPFQTLDIDIIWKHIF